MARFLWHDRQVEATVIKSGPGEVRIQVNVALTQQAFRDLALRFPNDDLACRAVNEVLREHLGELTNG